MKVRVKFSKQGNMKFIGHLDVMRYFQKAIRRARIDIAYTEGLSPHMIMSFASPLGVGLTSDAEYMDIELRTPVSSREAIDALNRVGVEGIEVTGFYQIPEGKANKAMTLVAAADYTVRFRKGYEPESGRYEGGASGDAVPGDAVQNTGGAPDAAVSGDAVKNAGDVSEGAVRKTAAPALWTDLPAAVSEFYAQEKIPVWKETKKSAKEVDIRPMICEMRCVPGESAVFLKLASGSAANLKPELVMEAMLARYGIRLEPFALEINRCELYADIGDEGARRLVPLSQLGSEIA